MLLLEDDDDDKVGGDVVSGVAANATSGCTLLLEGFATMDDDGCKMKPLVVETVIRDRKRNRLVEDAIVNVYFCLYSTRLGLLKLVVWISCLAMLLLS